MTASMTVSRSRAPGRGGVLTGLLALTLCLVPTLSAEERGPDDGGEAALSAAAEARKRAYDLDGHARDAALLEAARHFGAVSDGEQHARAVRAEAAFRAGEILRARGRLDEAASRFVQAVTVGEAGSDERAREFAARGLLEQAHAARRAEDTERATALYAAVEQRFGEHRRQCAHAATWAGKLALGRDDLEGAVDLLGGFAARFPEYPLEAIRNVELVAGALVEAGQRERAVKIITELRALMAEKTTDGTTMADRIARALEALSDSLPLSGY